MTLWFSSDLHIAHLNALTIMPHRPWSDVDSMSQGLIDNYNSIIKDGDTVIILGDLIMGKKFENVPKYLPQLKGNKTLLCGNHDFLPSEQKPDKLAQLEQLYLKNGISQIVYGCVSLDMFTGDWRDLNIKLCHFPTADTTDDRTNEYEQRYTHLRPTITDDEILFCGHTHSKQHLLKPNVYHVGVDAEIHDYKPVHIEDILSRWALQDVKIK